MGFSTSQILKNKAAYQDEAWFERERNVLDFRNWKCDLMGQTFYKTFTTTKTSTEKSTSCGILLLNYLNR